MTEPLESAGAGTSVTIVHVGWERLGSSADERRRGQPGRLVRAPASLPGRLRRCLSTLDASLPPTWIEAQMRTSEVLRTKGQDVVTVTGATPVSDLLALLAQHGIGAVVVSEDGRTPDGIVSERDVVRALAQRGASVLGEPVSAICSTEVSTVAPDTQVEALMRLMTEQRIRHVPVLVDGALHGIVSIGDVVKYRITELESERSALSDYIATAR